ncbi:aminodeoxychorismate synthase component I [Hyphobacterium sp. HN65]|uniref:Aminodeoxychorismate synthase component I n=1 Tax=Hyphobacterium lacteum TaxID=3116575 RepID=A0ABU7LNM6_9PROT|nr:aminodeoxychorismate synthase component I [Hyphobacterium sp. HN65]MEE2525520.1 aminodeoxychorismate synthase component I [Hyphobacterium sp. HN65]
MNEAFSETVDWIEPERAFAPFRTQDGALLLHGGQRSASRLYALPVDTLTFRQGDDLSVLLQKARGALADGHQLAGLFSYEFGHVLEPRTGLPPPGRPLVQLGVYPAWAVFDPVSRTLTLQGVDDGRRRLRACLEEGQPLPQPARGDLEPGWSREAYLAACRTMIEHIRAGDIYQANLSQGFSGHLTGDPWSVFLRLLERSDAPHAAWLRASDDHVVMTNSPERFLRLKGGFVESRPIKGTRPRKSDPAADRAEAEALAASEKDRAENLMIVDLVRNDISRVCRPGSVKVPQLNTVESYANVHHLVSTVTGQLAEGRDALDLILASFPAGSITGAPKIRAMELIREAEGEARGAYCGALGWIGYSGQSMDLNVMIRTLDLIRTDTDWQVKARSGGAITIDSDPAEEYDETLHKLSALRAALEG